jgi:hypothetical protein
MALVILKTLALRRSAVPDEQLGKRAKAAKRSSLQDWAIWLDKVDKFQSAWLLRGCSYNQLCNRRVQGHLNCFSLGLC